MAQYDEVTAIFYLKNAWFFTDGEYPVSRAMYHQGLFVVLRLVPAEQLTKSPAQEMRISFQDNLLEQRFLCFRIGPKKQGPHKMKAFEQGYGYEAV